MKNPLAHLSNLQQRVIVAVLGIGLFFGLILLGEMGTGILFLILTILCLCEFFKLCPFKIDSGLMWFGVSLGIVNMIFSGTNVGLGSGSVNKSDLLLIICPLLLIWAVLQNTTDPFQKISWMFLGTVYLSYPWVCMYSCGYLEGDFYPGIVLGLFGLLWASDSGAYFVGRSMGRTKLLERVSPKKTWEGFFGGLICACLLGFLLGHFKVGYPPALWIVLGISTAIFGTLGDLAESLLKRNLGIKDSGSMLPGHGGILDRFDGLFICAPVNYLIVNLFI